MGLLSRFFHHIYQLENMQKYKNSKIDERNKFKTALIFWMGFIFILSSIPNLKSDIPGISDFILRKGAHFVEYFVLMFLCIKAFYLTEEKIRFDKKLLFCFFLCSLYALSDEAHQLFTPTRKFAWFDWGIDNAGLLFGIIIFKVINLEKK